MGERNKKINILIVHNYYRIPGGEDIVVANEKKMLSKNNNVYEYYKNNSEIKDKGIINKIKYAANSIFSIKSYKEIKRIIKEKNIDVVHVHNTLAIISPSVYYACYKMKKPIVQTLHNFRFLCPRSILYRNKEVCMECLNHGMKQAVKFKCYRNSRIQSLLIVIMLKIHEILKTYNKINAFIALTEFDKEILKKAVNEEKIYVKPNFIHEIDPEYIKEDYFMYVGRLDEAKGIKILVEKFNQYKNSKLIVFGEGPLKEELLKYIKDNDIKNIIFKGYAKQDIVNKYLKKAKAVIVPSQCFESFGMVIIEGFAVGTPAIGHNIGSIGTLIEDNKNGLIFNKNDELLSKIDLLNNDDELLNKLIEGAVKSSRKYTVEENYKILMEIYENAIQDKVRGK